MDLLKDILRVATTKSDIRKTFPELADEVVDGSIGARFIRGIHSGSYKTDEDAAQDLYAAPRTDQRYRTLKSRFYERLLNSLLTLQIKQPDHSEYLTTYYKVTRNNIAAQTLVRFSARAAGTFVAERTLATAEKYQVTDVCISLLIILRESAGLTRNKRDFLELNSKLEYYIKLLEVECRSEYYLDSFMFESKRQKATIADLNSVASSYCQAIEKDLENYDTNLLRLNYYRMRLLRCEMMRDSEGGVAVAEAALEYLKANPRFTQPARIGEFSSSKMYFCVTLKRFEEALTMADDCLSTFASGGHNWYNAADLAFLAAMNVQQFPRAINYYRRAVEHPRFTVQPEVMVERFNNHLAYLYMLPHLGLYSRTDELPKPLRISTYLNSVPEFSKDKKGSNCTVLISHVLLLIITRQYDLVERRLDYLKVYSSRYLREKEFDRTRLFIRLLGVFPRSSFDPKRIKKNGQVLYQQLAETADEIALPEVVEVLPYELLYEKLVWVLEQHWQE